MYSISYRYNPNTSNPYSVYKQPNPNSHICYSVYKKTNFLFPYKFGFGWIIRIWFIPTLHHSSPTHPFTIPSHPLTPLCYSCVEDSIIVLTYTMWLADQHKTVTHRHSYIMDTPIIWLVGENYCLSLLKLL